MLVHPHEDFLRQILSVPGVLHHSVKEMNQRGAMPVQEDLKAGFIALADTQHQFGVMINCRSTLHGSLTRYYRKSCGVHSPSERSARPISSRMASAPMLARKADPCFSTAWRCSSSVST